MQKKNVPKKILHDIIQRIVEVAHPERIIMFGSAARGEMGPHSDIDLLVIKKGVRNPRDIAAKIYMRLYGVGKAVDIIVVSPKQVEKYRCEDQPDKNPPIAGLPGQLHMPPLPHQPGEQPKKNKPPQPTRDRSWPEWGRVSIK